MTLNKAPTASASSAPVVAMAPWYFCRQKANRQSPPGRQLLLLWLLPLRVPGTFWGPWECSLGSWEGAPLTFELPFSLPLAF